MDCSIADKIFEIVKAEGGCLHTTPDFCKFKVYLGIDSQGFGVFDVFKPSKELRSMIEEHALELRAWLDDRRKQWCKRLGVEP